MTVSKQNIAIGVIHNNEPERLNNITLASKYFDTSKKIKFFKYSDQKNIKFSFVSITYRNLIYLLVETRWLFYKKKISLREFVLIVYIGLKRIIYGSKKKHIVAIESIVTQKHLRLIQHILDTADVDFIFLLESDFIINNLKEFEIELIELIKIIPNKNQYFINLGSSFSMAKLGCLHLIGNTIPDTTFKNQIRPFTNTALAYGLSKNAAISFIQFCGRGKLEATYLPIDWMLNKYFMSKEAKNLKGIMCIANFVQHGSMVGAFKAWSRSF